ncbi:MAG: cytochrome c oxidase subunit [Acidobacteriota bacterium]
MDWLTGRFLLPPQGSAYAATADGAFLTIYWLSVVLFWGVTLTALYFAWRYQYKPGRVTPHQTHNTTLEIAWSVIPLLICVGLFFIGMNGFMKYAVAPGDAMEVSVTGKQWLWEFTYPDGSKTINDLHVPVNKPVKLVMTSEDVIHDFYIPDMRIKMDVVPGRYTQIWFQPTVLGLHTFTCAEYCGKDHSGMKGNLTVDSDDDFAKFMVTGGTEWETYRDQNRWAEWGALQYARKGCNSCHSVDGTGSKGPTWKGLFGKTESFADGSTAVVDAAYLEQSMLQPNAKVVKGFEPVMPTFQGLLRNHEIKGLIAYIESLK